METILVRRFRDLEFVARAFEDRPQRGVKLRRQGQRHRDGFSLLAREVRQMFFGETLKQALQLAREANECIPSPVDREVVAAGVQKIYFAPELGQGTQHLHLAGEKLLVEDGNL